MHESGLLGLEVYGVTCIKLVYKGVMYISMHCGLN